MKYFVIVVIVVIAPFSEFVYALDKARWNVGVDLLGIPCMDHDTAPVGPYDYTDKSLRSKHLGIVEAYHFTDKIKRLQNDKGSVQDNLNYTLSAWPNHHGALKAVSNYHFLYSKKMKEHPLFTPAECYLKRAINFSRSDGVSYLLYARFLTKMKQYKEADKLYNRTMELLPDNPVVLYNYGSLLFKMKEFKKAKEYAELAKKHGHPYKKLLGMLKKKGY
ncbi:MAG: hypothetical protein GQ532_18780 [Methylomarinum sp.]|nr:hypothetical protein [Methylomarinum sp.]